MDSTIFMKRRKVQNIAKSSTGTTTTGVTRRDGMLSRRASTDLCSCADASFEAMRPCEKNAGPEANSRTSGRWGENGAGEVPIRVRLPSEYSFVTVFDQERHPAKQIPVHSQSQTFADRRPAWKTAEKGIRTRKKNSFSREKALLFFASNEPVTSPPFRSGEGRDKY